MDSIRIRGILDSKLARVIFMTAVSILTVVILNGAIVAKHLVVINDGDTVITVYTSEDQPDTILTQQNISLSRGDTYDFSGFHDHKAAITVNRAKEVTVSVDKEIITDVMQECTVAQALDEFDVSVNPDDLINVSVSEEIVDGMTIEINRVSFENITEQHEIEYDVVETKTPTLKDNKRKTLKPGAEGILETVTKKKFIDGVQVDEYVVSSQVLQEPVTAQVLVGDSDVAVSRLAASVDVELDDNGDPVSYQQKIVGKATAYSSQGRSTSLKPGNVAMDTTKFPKGTKLYIKTPDGSFVYGYSVVKDTGHALMNGDILVDLFFSSYRESCLFGAKNVEIYVL